MAQGDCKRRIVRFAKRGAIFIGPVIGALVPQMVSVIELLKDKLPEMFGGHEKRALVLEAIKLEARRIGHAGYDSAKDKLTGQMEGYIRAALEATLENLRAGQPLEKLQNWVSDDQLLDADTD